VTRLRILVADDHDVVRRGVRALLEAERGWDVVAEASNGQQAVAAARRAKPDVAVLDIAMPEMNGLEAARAIVAQHPRTEVLILTMHESEQVLREVLAAGARGYVLKSDAGRDLVAAVDALRRHRSFLAPRATEIALASVRTPPAASASLTPREREVLQLLAEGHANKEVAATLGISTKTVEAHRSSLMRKLHARSAADLVRYAIRNKMIEA
jgi:DNA-binding NarL/FixJ family response regulator